MRSPDRRSEGSVHLIFRREAVAQFDGFIAGRGIKKSWFQGSVADAARQTAEKSIGSQMASSPA